MLQRLGRDEIEELLARDEPARTATSELGSAADYISNLFERGLVQEQAKLREPVAPDYSMPPPSAPMVMPSMPTASIPPPPPVAKRAVYAYGPPTSTSESGVAQETPHPEEESTWHRVTVAPGVELHFRASAGARVRSVMSRLIAAVGNILETSPEKETKEK